LFQPSRFAALGAADGDTFSKVASEKDALAAFSFVFCHDKVAHFNGANV
jgi:hypothetical protein